MKVAPTGRMTQNEPPARKITTPGSQSTELVTDVEAAARFQLEPSTLRSWRCRGIGPTYTKLGPGKRGMVRR